MHVQNSCAADGLRGIQALENSAQDVYKEKLPNQQVIVFAW